MFNQTAFMDMGKNKDLENQFMDEVEKVLQLMGKSTEANINAIMHVAWYNSYIVMNLSTSFQLKLGN